MSANRMADLLGLPRIEAPTPIEDRLIFPRVRAREATPAASPEDQLAREVVARIEREDGYGACAIARLNGAYDGDHEHRIALLAIREAREFFQSTVRDGERANNPSPVNK